MTGAEDRAFLSCRAGRAVPSGFPDALAWERAAMLHIAEYATLADQPDLVSRAKAANLLVALDPSWDDTLIGDPGLLEACAGVDIFLPNIEEAVAITGKADPAEALAVLAGHFPIVAMKCGKHGALLGAGDIRISASAPKVAAIDTTGAGDLYAAGFLYGYTQGRDLPTCGRLASLAAGEAVSHLGPRPSRSLAELVRSHGL